MNVQRVAIKICDISLCALRRTIKIVQYSLEIFTQNLVAEFMACLKLYLGDLFSSICSRALLKFYGSSYVLCAATKTRVATLFYKYKALIMHKNVKCPPK